MSAPVSLDLGLYIDRAHEDWIVFLLELTHPDYPDVMRIATSYTTRLGERPDGSPYYGIRSNLGQAGQPQQDYLYLPVLLTPPSQEEDAVSSASLSIARHDELVVMLRSVRTRVRCDMYQVSAHFPDRVLEKYPGFWLSTSNLGGASISLDITADTLESEGFPGLLYYKRYFPGVHA
ncbi:hypothetical protein AB9L11_00825 [Desulfovibrio piger]|uniref:hypothetical protein n=1 Tax=Desulfovibrio piger TaxID=901 RepID=UPI0026EE09DA|nr:hypothetical protein [Desulfovibrio piger]